MPRSHHHEGAPVLEHVDVEDAGHVRALEAGDGSPLALEADHDLGHRPDLRPEELHSHALIEPEVARLEDDPHPSAPDDANDLVFAGEDGPRRW